MEQNAMSNASSLSYPILREGRKGRYKSPTGESLEDRSKRGKLRNWRLHKQTSEKLVECYYYAGWDTKAFNVGRCASYLDFEKCKVDERHYSKLVGANFCRDRMCSQCQWRRSMRQFGVAVKVGHELKRRDPTVEFIFLTLTIPNVLLEELSAAIDALFDGWGRLRKRTEIKNIMLGYHRALEISYNATENTFHPHIHAAIVVPASYFSHGYIKRDRWLEMWQEAMRMPDITQVDVRKIRGKKGQDEIISGFAEACKYSLKYWTTSLNKQQLREVKKRVKNLGVDFGMPGHIWLRKTLEETASVVVDLSSALHNRRLVQFGGVLRDIKRELKLKDAEEGGDLVNTSDEKTHCNCPVCGADTIRHLYRWFDDVGDYIG